MQWMWEMLSHDMVPTIFLSFISPLPPPAKVDNREEWVVGPRNEWSRRWSRANLSHGWIIWLSFVDRLDQRWRLIHTTGECDLGRNYPACICRCNLHLKLCYLCYLVEVLCILCSCKIHIRPLVCLLMWITFLPLQCLFRSNKPLLYYWFPKQPCTSFSVFMKATNSFLYIAKILSLVLQITPPHPFCTYNSKIKM